jgi:hypothetical protein
MHVDHEQTATLERNLKKHNSHDKSAYKRNDFLMQDKINEILVGDDLFQ